MFGWAQLLGGVESLDVQQLGLGALGAKVAGRAPTLARLGRRQCGDVAQDAVVWPGGCGWLPHRVFLFV